MARRSRGGARGKGTINVSIDLTPSPRTMIERNNSLKDKLTDWRPVWKRVIPKLRRHMGRVWMTGGSAAGEKWKPWKASYVRRRPGGALGVLTGKLLNQITTKGVLSRTKSTLRFGARGAGVRAFHFGVTGRQHARPYVVATPQVMAMVTIEWQSYIEEVAGQWAIRGRGRAATNAMIRRKAT